MIFGLMLIPLIGLLGLAVDYSQANRVKTALDAALDAAVLAAATTTSQYIQSKQTPTNDPTTAAEQAGQAAGLQVFAATISTLAPLVKDATGSAQAALPIPTITVGRVGLTLSATGSYDAATKNLFGEIFGDQVWPITGTSQAALSLPKYQNIYFLLDNSQSMGIASSQQDQTNLAFATLQYTTAYNPGGAESCQFGCHASDGHTAANVTFEGLAKTYNILLRIDALRESVQDVINIVQGSGIGTPRVQFEFYTMSDTLTELTSNGLSSDYPALLTQSNSIDLGQTDFNGYGDSWTTAYKSGTSGPDLLTQFYNKLAAANVKQGDGSSYTTPEIFVFIITDGTTDVPGPCVDGHCVTAWNYNECAPLKAIANVGVIYTTYTPFNDQRYTDLVAPIASQILPNLQACATSGYFYQATTGDEIRKAAVNLFGLAASSGTLTQ
jgi:Flp pilus assembly protein TadG